MYIYDTIYLNYVYIYRYYIFKLCIYIDNIYIYISVHINMYYVNYNGSLLYNIRAIYKVQVQLQVILYNHKILRTQMQCMQYIAGIHLKQSKLY